MSLICKDSFAVDFIWTWKLILIWLSKLSDLFNELLIEWEMVKIEQKSSFF